MKKKIFSSNDLLFYFETSTFPKNLISEDIMIHKDFIFSETGEEPEMSTQPKKKNKLSVCFIIEEELEKMKGFNAKKPHDHNKAQNKGQFKSTNWRKNEQEEQSSGGFFDEFKGKTDEKQVSQFKRNLSNTQSKEGSISIINSVLVDHFEVETKTPIRRNSSGIENKEKTVASLHKKEIKEDSIPGNNQNTVKTTTISADNFFDNADKILAGNTEVISEQNNQIKSNKQPEKVLTQLTKTITPHVEEFNIKNIYKINEFLQYPKDEPLWYIFHPTAKSSFGPITSVNIEEMFNGKMLSEKSEIRFIDIYNLRNKKSFSFFALKEISNQGFINEIDISSLLRVAVNIKSREREIEIKEEVNNSQSLKTGLVMNKIEENAGLKENITQTKTTNAVITIKSETTTPLDQKCDAFVNQPKANNENTVKKEIYSPESIYNLSSHNQSKQKSNEDTFYEKGDAENKGAKNYGRQGKSVYSFI